MGQKEKLIQRLKSNPKDFTFDDAESLLKYFDYECSIKAKQAVPVLFFPTRNTEASCFTNHIRETS
ncbi:type II toxin-antitoxin system HicA family toxin [Stomatobaculum longum]|uniref:type II toxin-antitoxin system HicA family toxin n=1 Tax=Stomatobaculum longum TaxID=796942 RepID=UPI0028805D33|nr:type II toxin-antitoxin system HicA family toxin [Stomatobaculum longum]